MKKFLSASPVIFSMVYLLTPLLQAITYIAGYRFHWNAPSVTIAVIAFFSIACTAALFRSKPPANQVNQIFSALLLPISLMNSMFFLFQIRRLAIPCIFICCVCAAATFFSYAKPRALKIASGILSGLLTPFLLFCSFIVLVFDGMGHQTIVKSMDSPQGAYVAEIINDDQGALGGNTTVIVQNQRKRLPLLICEFVKAPEQIYIGDWGEFDSMQLKWEDEHTLILNGKRYTINK